MTDTEQVPGDLNHMSLIRLVAEESGVKREDVAKVLRAMFDVVGRAVAQGSRVRIANFGSWLTRTVPNTRNPKTGESTGAVTVVRFRATGKLADAVKTGEIVGSLKKLPSRPIS